jgi:two-component system response regulator HydG
LSSLVSNWASPLETHGRSLLKRNRGLLEMLSVETKAKPKPNSNESVRDRFYVYALDDDRDLVEITTEMLKRAGFRAVFTTDPEEALEAVRGGRCHAVISDIQMPALHGFQFLEKALQLDPSIRVILVTGHYSIDSAIEAIKRGAYDYLPKPIDYARLVKTLDDLASSLERRSQIRELEEKLAANIEFDGIVGRSPAMLEALELVRKVSKHYNNVLLIGPTGAGKELFAHALHELSPVATERFAVCNCSALVDTLLESQLFGHVRGAFTGAFDTRPGLFEYANRGTVFLDEIGETSPQMQAKLLRVIQNREIQRVGSPEVKKINVRVIAATNRDLRSEVSAGRFREDLFYRLSTIEIRIPSLIERSEDIPLLIRYFIKKSNEQYGRHFQGMTRRAELVLLKYQWPGNVRELENAISGAAITAAGDCIDVEDLPKHIQTARMGRPGVLGATQPLPLEEVERAHVHRVLEMCNGNQVRASEILGISRTSLYRHLKRVSARAGSE